MLSPSDRVLVESLDVQESPREFGYFYADEVPEGISESGWNFLMDLCRYRVFLANPCSMLAEAAEHYKRAWEEALEADLSWPGFEREPPSSFQGSAE